MAETDTNPSANWQRTLRQRGEAGPHIAPSGTRRPPPPERRPPAEQGLWQRLVESRQPPWFSGSLEILEAHTQLRQLGKALREADPAGPRYAKLARAHRLTAAVAVNLAVKPRLTPSSKLDPRTPQEGELPVGWQRQ